MELNREVFHYILRNHPHLMTDIEQRAQAHLVSTLKATMGRSDIAAQEEARRSRLGLRLSDDPEVLRLTREGYKAFQTRTAKRLLQECSEAAVLRMSEATRLSSTPEVADAATQMTKLARQIRLQCLLEMGKLISEYAIPYLRFRRSRLSGYFAGHQ